MAPLLESLFHHMAWADARVSALLASSAVAASVPNVQRWLAHLVAAERVWLMRLGGQDSTTHPIWPEWSIEQIHTTSEENARAFKDLTHGLTDEGAARIVEYRNSQGTTFRTAAGDILAHIALHGSYHRGQIAAALRAGGVAPVNTDYITYIRERAV